MKKKRIGILTGGGDVAPLNSVIAAAQQASLDHGIELIGFIKGWQGVAEKQFVPLSGLSVDPSIGGTILKSSRINLGKIEDGIEKVNENFKRLKLDGLIVIGGEDTLSNCFLLGDIPQVLISKTIDNDVGIISKNGHVNFEEIMNYFTLGFPTAAEKISSFVSLKEGVRTTAYSHERVIVVESMGMHAGWLALASAMGHADFIIIPEFPLNYEEFKNAVLERYKIQKNLIIMIAEGARWDNGMHVSADESEMDDFGHPRFKGSAEKLAQRLKEDLKNEFNVRNVNPMNPSYLYRSGAPVNLDRQWGANLGRESVKLISEGIEEPVFLGIQRKAGEFSNTLYRLRNFKDIGVLHRFVDERFYNSRSYSITSVGKEYFSAIFKEIPFADSYGLKG